MDNTIQGAESIRVESRIPFAAPFVIAIALIAFLYGAAFRWWWQEWTVLGSFYAHSLFVPFFVAAMVWRNRAKLKEEPWAPSYSGVWIIAPSILILMFGLRLDVTFVQSISFMGLVFGASLMLLGKGWTRILAFPLGFISLMMPLLPDQYINIIAFPIQMASAHLATILLNVLHLHADQQGTLIQMTHYRMAVELPCSGFKTLVSLMTFTAAFAYLVEGERWKQWTLFFVTMPLSLIINGLRITFIGIVGELVSTPAAAVFHDWSGFIVLTLGFLFLFTFARVIKCKRFLGVPLTADEEAKDRAEHEANDGNVEPDWWQVIAAWRPTLGQLRRVLPYIVAFDCVLLVSAGADVLVKKSIIPDTPIATFQVPTDFASSGVSYFTPPDPMRDKLTKDVAETLSPFRVISRNYGGSDNSQINLFITAGNGRRTFHDPHSCSLGANAVLSDVGPITVPTKYGDVVFQECTFKHTDSPNQYEMFIAYVIEGKLRLKAADMRNSIIRQMLLGDSGKPSYFVRITQNEPGADSVHRNQLLRFTSGMWDHIGQILTGKEKGEKDDSTIVFDDVPAQ